MTIKNAEEEYMKNMKFIPINENKIAALLNSEKDIIKIEVNNKSPATAPTPTPKENKNK